MIEIINRSHTHGHIEDNAEMGDELMRVIERWWIDVKESEMSPTMRTCFFFICHKIARFVTGDHTSIDHMEDVAGYAKLLNDHVQGVR